jgi:hypothetical protein
MPCLIFISSVCFTLLFRRKRYSFCKKAKVDPAWQPCLASYKEAKHGCHQGYKYTLLAMNQLTICVDIDVVAVTG